MTSRELVQKILLTAWFKRLTDSDLALWFDRPRQTVASWSHGHKPREGPVFDELVRRLKILDECEDFPVPYSIHQRERRAYIKKAFADADDAYNRRVSSGNSPVVGPVLHDSAPRRESKPDVLPDNWEIGGSHIGKYGE
jgi:hypothetical protein